MSPDHAERARDLGATTVDAIRRRLARKAASLIKQDREAADMALELGLIDRAWLDSPGKAPMATAAPTEMLQRFWERAVEQRPSRISSLGLSAAQLIAGRSAPPSGRQEALAVVFTDLEGFTSFTAMNGDEAALKLVQEHHRLAGPIVRRSGGKIVKRLGDGLLCTFVTPGGGLLAAVELLATAPHPLKLRAGVHVGEAIVSPDDVIGHVVNVAARVAETAPGGHAVATEDAVAAAGPTPGVVTAGKPRSRRLKGVSERVTVVEIRPAKT